MFTNIFKTKTRKERIQKQQKPFEFWAKSQYPMINHLMSFNKDMVSYEDQIVNQLWAGWLGAKGF